MSIDRGYRGQGPGSRDPDPSSGTRRNRNSKFCPPPKDDSARLSKGVGDMSGSRFDDCPAGAGSPGQPGTSHRYIKFLHFDIRSVVSTQSCQRTNRQTNVGHYITSLTVLMAIICTYVDRN